jgi:hypothetical protein
MTDEETKLQCYNKGCLKQYSQEEDVDGACVHHPGVPVFHDAMKGWSCCKKRSTDFTDFLNIPGCTVGRHNPVKPVEPERVKEKPLAVGEEIIVKAPLPRKTERPPEDLPMVQLRVKVANSLKSLLARLGKQQETQTPAEDTETDGGGGEMEIGTSCKNKGCTATYYGPDVELTSCRHHPGMPIFHEGYKFWTCCQRRTSDFDEFLRQEGCTSGDHKWIETEKKEVSCRYDWHQTGTQVVVSFYAKACVPEQCLFEANPTSAHILISFDNGKHQQLTELQFYGVIDIAQSSVELLGTKAELKLRKADPIPWASLQPQPPATAASDDDKPQNDE